VATAGSRCFLAPNRKGAGDRHRDRDAPGPIKNDRVPSQNRRDEPQNFWHITLRVAETKKPLAMLGRPSGYISPPLMGLSGSYRAERHFKRFRYAFIHFIHKMITPLLLQIRDSPFSLVGIAGLGDDSSRQQSRTMKSNDRGRDGISLDEIRARSKE